MMEAIRVAEAVLNGLKVLKVTGEGKRLNSVGASKLCSEWGYWETANWIREHQDEYATGLREGFEPAG